MTPQTPDAFRRYQPFTRFRVTVDGEGEVVQTFKPLSTVRLAFVLAKVEDFWGLDACTLQIRPTGDSGQKFLAPDENAQARVAPPLSLLVPPSLHRADEYPSIVDGIEVGPAADTQSFDVVVQNIAGDTPYNVDLYFFAYPGDC